MNQLPNHGGGCFSLVNHGGGCFSLPNHGGGCFSLPITKDSELSPRFVSTTATAGTAGTGGPASTTPSEIPVFVQLGSHTMVVNLGSAMTASDVTEVIAARTGVPASELTVMYHGKPLSRGVVSDYEINADANLIVIGSLRAGVPPGAPKTAGVSFSTEAGQMAASKEAKLLETKKMRAVETEEDKYQTAGPGLFAWALCTAENCPAKGKAVVCSFGMKPPADSQDAASGAVKASTLADDENVLNIAELDCMAKCPACQAEVVPTNWGMIGCRFKWSGIYRDEKNNNKAVRMVPEQQEWQMVRNGDYYHFSGEQRWYNTLRVHIRPNEVAQTPA